MNNSLKSLFFKLAPSFIVSAAKRLHYIKSLKSFDKSHEPDLAISELLISPGNTVIDIGANIGWYTKVFSECVGSTGCVYSIEPIPSTYEILRYCIKKLELTNVIAFNFGLSDKSGTSWMEVPRYESSYGDNFYMARIVGTKTRNPALTSYEVQLSTLDELLVSESSMITFIKCDVEGHEWQVVKGAKHIISDIRPAWLIEISSDPVDTASDANKIFSQFNKFGYSPYWYDQLSNSLNPYKAGDNSVNYFFLTGSQYEGLRAKGVNLC